MRHVDYKCSAIVNVVDSVVNTNDTVLFEAVKSYARIHLVLKRMDELLEPNGLDERSGDKFKSLRAKVLRPVFPSSEGLQVFPLVRRAMCRTLNCFPTAKSHSLLPRVFINGMNSSLFVEGCENDTPNFKFVWGITLTGLTCSQLSLHVSNDEC